MSSLVIREIQIKPTLRLHLEPIRKAKIKNTDENLCGVKRKFLHCWRGVQTDTAPCDINQYDNFSEFRKQPLSRPSNITFGYIPKECSIITQEHVLN